MAIFSKLTIPLYLLTAAASFVGVSSTSQPKGPYSKASCYDFHPSTAGIQTAELIDPLPLAYDFNTSNSAVADATNSWWSSSFITGSDNHQYLLLAHAMTTTSFSVYRGSIYDITEAAFKQFSVETSQNFTANSSDGKFNIQTSDFFFGSALADNSITRLRTAANHTDVQFDLTYALDAPVILNTGIGGLFQFGNDQTAEWSMPAGKTTGWLTFDGRNVSVNMESSQTWYDRQWNVGPATSGMTWTWFQLHLSNKINEQSDILSVWSYNSDVKGHRQWATTQSAAGLNLVQPVRSVSPLGSSWSSPHTNITYDQAWTVTLQDNTCLTVKTTYEDQELWTTGFATYEGFVTVTGTDAFGESVTGYGLVEVQGSS
ncbi:hypothetical protein AnigIFM60653_002403 [Aspergillus niger]|nr:hypothetical protein AnigIFM60653_002403 [Aspergillus niger]